MHTTRAVIRMVLICVVTLVHAMGLIGSFVVLGWLGRRMRTGLRHFFAHSWAKSVVFLMGVRLVVVGDAPRPPFFLVSNHLSYLDIPVFFCLVRGVFVAKSEVGSWPLIGWLSKLANTLFIDRQRRRDLLRVNSLMSRHMTSQEGIILFPEGTSTRGARINKFKPALLQAPAHMGFPVHYATISYRSSEASKPAHLGVCWWGDMTFADHFFGLLGIRRVDAMVSFGSDPVRHEDRKELAESLWRRMTDQFEPVVVD